MNKKLVIPFIIWLLFLALDIASLIRGISEQQNLRIIGAGVAMTIAIAFLVFILRNQHKEEVKAVPVRNKN